MLLPKPASDAGTIIGSALFVYGGYAYSGGTWGALVGLTLVCVGAIVTAFSIDAAVRRGEWL